MFDRLKNNRYALFAVVVASIFAFRTFAYTTEMPIIKDAKQNVTAAYYLAHVGVIGGKRTESDDAAPQMYREPLPIVVTAAFLLLHPAFQQPYTVTELTNGSLAKTVKGVNALWRFLAAIFIFLLCTELFPDRRIAAAVALICLIVSEPLFFAISEIVDRMYTELPEVALMLLAAWCAVRFVRGKTKLRAIWLGVALGGLALTKTAFLYIGLCFIVLLLVTDRPKHFQTSPEKRAWSNLLPAYAVIALAMLATVAPWIARNYVAFGNPQIASGTEGQVLGIRMLLTEQPLLGQIYFYSPSDGLRKLLVGPLTGYTAEDLGPGGRLEQLAGMKQNKWDIVSQRIKAQDYQGTRNAWLKRSALDAAIQNPLRYIASIGVFAYKGMWFMTPAGALFNLAAFLCFFGVFFGALFTGRQYLVAAFGLPAGLFFFISTFTHALTRYNACMTPFVIISVLWLLIALFRRAYQQSPRFQKFADRWTRAVQAPSEAKSASQRRPTEPTSSAETASRA